MNATVIDFQKKLSEKNQRLDSKNQSAHELQQLRSLIARYEEEMWLLRETMSEEELEAFLPLSAEEKIAADLDILNHYVDSLESILTKHSTLSASEANQRLKQTCSAELFEIILSLEEHSYPTFVEMMAIICSRTSNSQKISL